MADKKRSAGDLYNRVAFDKRVATNDPDNDGNYLAEWEEQFTCRAGYIHLRGGESVLQSRLSGQHTQVIFVRASSETKAVTAEWRIRDVNTGEFDVNGNWTGTEFNIRDITLSDDRAWLDFLSQSGVPSG